MKFTPFSFSPGKIGATMVLILTSVLLGVLFYCGDENPTSESDALPIDISILVTPPEDTSRDSTKFHVNEEVKICIQALEQEPIDSIVVGYIINPDDSISKSDLLLFGDTICSIKDIKPKNDITFKFDRPGKMLLVGLALSKDPIEIDTCRITISEGNNQPPTIKLTPIRHYAATTLPCTLHTVISNPEPWQTIKLSSEDSIVTLNNSMCIWFPTQKDSIGIHQLTITATDDGNPNESSVAQVPITLLNNGDLPSPPQNLRLIEQTAQIVKIAWEDDSLIDSFMVFRSPTATFDSIKTFKTTAPTFVDTVSSICFYRIVAINFFGNSDYGNTIISSDPIHYGHAIHFRDSITIASENEPVCVIPLQVSEVAKKDITAWLTVKEKNAAAADYSIVSNKVTIFKGTDTASFKLAMTDDTIVEPAETLTIAIENVSSGFAAGYVENKVVIISNDTIYTVKYLSNGAAGGDVPIDSTKYHPGDSLIIAANSGDLVKKGSTFTGWSTAANGTGTVYTPGTILPASVGSLTLFARWSSNPTFTITYAGNSNNSGNAPKDSAAYETGEVIQLPGAGTLARKGYSFTGWNNIPDGTGVIYLEDASYTIGVINDTLYAQWKINKYTISYNGNGTDVNDVPPSTTYVYNSRMKISSETPTRKGYTFFRWNTTSTGDGIDYLPGDSLLIEDSNITLYARWTTNKYTLAYNGNNQSGGVVPEAVTVAYNSEIKIAAQGTLIRTGSQFDGWNSLADGTGLFFHAETTITMPAINLELFAIWKPNLCKVVFDTRGGVPTNIEVTVNWNSPLTAPVVPTKTGYIFASWHPDSLYNSTAWNFTTDRVFDNTTLYAKWVSDSSWVTFDTRGGTPAKTELMVKNGSILPPPTVPSKTGHTFIGWYKDSTFTVTWNFLTEQVITFSTLYAKWDKNIYDVIYTGNENTTGSVTTTVKWPYNDSVTVSAKGDLVRTGYTFIGWNTAANGSGTTWAPGAKFQMSTNTVTLYALWRNPDEMVRVPAKDRTFSMGDRNFNHPVKFTADFWMDTTEVTQWKYDSLMKATYSNYNKPSWNNTYGVGNSFPAYDVNWFDAALYCNARTKATGSSDTVYAYTLITGAPGDSSIIEGILIYYERGGFRLPTDAQWEFACRGGTTTDYYWGKDFDPYPASVADSSEVDSYAIWYGNSAKKGSGNSEYGTHRVATKIKNGYGLYDMSGNVFEWCNDLFGSFTTELQIDPTGATTGTNRTIRGGSWYIPSSSYQVSYLRSGQRSSMIQNESLFKYNTDNRLPGILGFRTCLPAK